MAIALITGVLGMDGSHLSKLLLEKGLEVHGCIRPVSHHNYWRHDRLGIRDEVYYHCTDLLDPSSVNSAVRNIKPDYIFNLAAQSQVGKSFECPVSTTQVNAIGALNVFEAAFRYAPQAKVYQASTSEMFGIHQPSPEGLSLAHTFKPVSPYGAAKLYAHNMASVYRKQGLNITCGVLFNHESKLRGNEFVTQKICKGIADFKKSGKKIKLGNVWAKRDWGHAEDYVDVMWRMTEHRSNLDLVVCTGSCHSVQDFIDAACKVAGLSEHDFIESVNADLRPCDIDWLCGNMDCRRYLEIRLGWQVKHTFDDIVKEMVESAIQNPTE